MPTEEEKDAALSEWIRKLGEQILHQRPAPKIANDLAALHAASKKLVAHDCMCESCSEGFDMLLDTILEIKFQKPC